MQKYLQTLFTDVKISTNVIYRCKNIYKHYLQMQKYLLTLSTDVKISTNIIYRCKNIY